MIPFVIFIVVAFVLWRGLFLKPNVIPSPLIGKAAPSFHLKQLPDSSKKTSEKDFIGHITLVNVWATWCVACRAEHEFLLKLSNHRDLMLYGLNYKDDAEKAKQWLSVLGNPYQIVAFDPEGKVAIDWGVYGTPETFILDKKGVVRHKHIGPISMEVWERDLQPVIRKLGNEPA
jgi:cytochrome c biogenesis protein CcmG/thiol:disulfide interchange protein DsbE